MARFFRNRTANEWRAVLEAFGYRWTNNKGDDQIWTHKNSVFAVLVPSRNETLLLPTSESMARKIRLGIGVQKKDILKWWKENGYGD